MSINLNVLPAISAEIREWLDRRDTRQNARDETTRIAVQSISRAVLRTRAYLGQAGSADTERDLEKEQKLSELWNEAYQNLREVDPELADRCFLKADFWADRTSLDANNIQQYNITLDSMAEAVRSFPG